MGAFSFFLANLWGHRKNNEACSYFDEVTCSLFSCAQNSSFRTFNPLSGIFLKKKLSEVQCLWP